MKVWVRFCLSLRGKTVARPLWLFTNYTAIELQFLSLSLSLSFSCATALGSTARRERDTREESTLNCHQWYRFGYRRKRGILPLSSLVFKKDVSAETVVQSLPVNFLNAAACFGVGELASGCAKREHCPKPQKGLFHRQTQPAGV